jgi:hypothetical protein
MNDPLKMLQRDHRKSLDILHDLRVSEPGRERALLLTQLRSSFANHRALESDLVHPLVADAFGQDEASDPGIEDAMLGECLDQLTLLLEEPGFCLVAAMMAGGLKYHLKREEKSVLPMLKKSLGTAEWHALGDRLLVAKAEAEAKQRVDAAAILQSRKAVAATSSGSARKLVPSR